MRNPDWNWDEDVLALELYVRRGMAAGGPLLGRHDADVIELSDFLNSLPVHEKRGEGFRNPDGVARKLGNLRSVQHPGTGSTHAAEMDRRVWAEFDGLWPELSQIATRIREAVPTLKDADGVRLSLSEDDGEFEGEVLLSLHRRRERSRALVARKKAGIMAAAAKLVCEVCTFDFAITYGSLGEGFIECHHKVPLSKAGPSRTRLKDLALLCANCHRMVHSRNPWLTLDQLQAALHE